MQNHTSFVVEQNPVMHEEIKCSLHCILLQRHYNFAAAQLSELQRNASETLTKSTLQFLKDSVWLKFGYVNPDDFEIQNQFLPIKGRGGVLD